MFWNQRQIRFWHLAGAISESRHVCSRESEFPPTLRTAAIGKVAKRKPKQGEHVKYKYTKC